MLLLAIALPVAVATAREDCEIPRNWSRDDPKPFQAAGPGLWIGGIAFNAADIASVVVETEPMTQAWAIKLSFTPAGNTKFLQAQRCGVGRPIEFSIDRRAVSRPVLNAEIRGGAAIVTGGWQAREEAEAVARRIAVQN